MINWIKRLFKGKEHSTLNLNIKAEDSCEGVQEPVISFMKFFEDNLKSFEVITEKVVIRDNKGDFETKLIHKKASDIDLWQCGSEVTLVDTLNNLTFELYINTYHIYTSIEVKSGIVLTSKDNIYILERLRHIKDLRVNRYEHLMSIRSKRADVLHRNKLSKIYCKTPLDKTQ